MDKELKFDVSKDLYIEAQKYIPQGVNSAGRSSSTFKPHPIFIDKGIGSKIYDVDGNKFIDYYLAAGPLILGHNPKIVIDGVKKQLDKGTIFWSEIPLTIELAKNITNIIPSAEMVRFSSTGTEAVIHAIRMARGFTNKNKIIKFEGQYHGDIDYFITAWSYDKIGGSKDNPFKFAESKGIPEKVLDDILIAEWNNVESIEKVVLKNRDEIAAIITAPIVCSCGVIPPTQKYLQILREICDENNILLIFDEIVTGFRVALGGAQEYYKVIPDICVTGKAMGSGFPISAIMGKEEIMNILNDDKVVHLGTFNANPLCITASNITINHLKKGVLGYIHKQGDKLIKGINDSIQDLRIEAIIQGHESVFQLFFTKLDQIESCRELNKVNHKKYEEFSGELKNRGVWTYPKATGHWFISEAHDDETIDETINIIYQALKRTK